MGGVVSCIYRNILHKKLVYVSPIGITKCVVIHCAELSLPSSRILDLHAEKQTKIKDNLLNLNRFVRKQAHQRTKKSMWMSDSRKRSSRKLRLRNTSNLQENVVSKLPGFVDSKPEDTSETSQLSAGFYEDYFNLSSRIGAKDPL